MTEGQGPTGLGDRTLKLLDTGAAACRGYDREDLLGRIAAARAAAVSTQTRVVVCGEFKQGKSSLVNALLDTDVCPVDDDVATAIPTLMLGGGDHGGQFEAVSFGDTPDVDSATTVSHHRQSLNRSDAQRAIVQPGSYDPPVDTVEVKIKNAIAGITLVDTPGTGGLGSTHAKATLATLPTAGAALFVSDASQEYTQAELEFLRRCVDLCPMVIGVLSKIDLQPQWREIWQANQSHLQAAGIEMATLVVASQLHVEGRRVQDNHLIQESGIPQLRKHLHDDIGRVSIRRRLRDSLDELRHVLDQLRAPFRAEKQALLDPSERERTMAELEAAREKASALKSSSARWQVTLNDGFSDLMSDVDHDFRDRIRRTVAEANAIIDEGEPHNIWNEFAPWFEQRIADEVLNNFEILHERSETMNERVGALFAADTDAVTADLQPLDPNKAMERVNDLASPDFTRQSTFAAGMSAIRGGQSGMMTFRSLSGLALGATAFSPVGLPIMAMTAVAALAAGRGAVRQGRERQTSQQRNAAKGAIRSYSDEVSFRVAKELQATMRATQRSLRDHYTARAEELHQTSARSIEAATNAAKAAAQNDGGARLKDIEAELTRIDSVEGAATALIGELT